MEDLVKQKAKPQKKQDVPYLNLKNKKNSTWTEYWYNAEEEYLLKQGLKLMYFDPSIDVGEI